MRTSMAVLVGCCVALTSGCSGKPTLKSAAQEFLKITGEVGDVLATVKDKASAEQARTKLKSLAERARAVAQQMKGLGEPSADDKAWMQKEFLPGFEANVTKMSQALGAIEDPEVKKLAGEVMMEFALGAQGGAGVPGK